jgi:broad specificity phosphatase PhoE
MPRFTSAISGSWEGRSWNDIYAKTGDAMMGMLTAPENFRPGGGETTNELGERVLLWQRSLLPGVNILAVCHGDRSPLWLAQHEDSRLTAGHSSFRHLAALSSCKT